MDWRLLIYFALLLLLLWLAPFVPPIFGQNATKVLPDTSASDRRLLRLCLRGLAVIAAVLLLCKWVG